MTDVTATLEAAAVPAVVSVLEAAQAAFATIFTGDPATAAVRAGLAGQKFLADAGLALLAGGGNEFTAVGSLVQGGLADLITKVKAKAAPAA